MIYLKINNANMKTKKRTVPVSFWAMLGIAILLTNLALIRTVPTMQEATATPVLQTGATDASTGTQSEVGSTDGIMFVAVIIVLIVITPILLKRRAWQNGKRKNQ